MAINRVDNRVLTPLRPEDRHFVRDDPARGPGATGLEIAEQGCETLDRASQSEYSANRRYPLTPPAPRVDDTEPGDAVYAPINIYPA